MNCKTLRDEAMQVLGNRNRWEQKQRLFYQMRHEGIRRANKPFPRAADFHLPIVDSNIGKQKPFWFGQAANNEQLATFVSLRPQAAGMSTGAAEYMDYQLRHKSNYLDELTEALDTMLLRGRGVLKSTVNPFDNYAIEFEAIDPLYLIVADGASDLDTADWFVHVKTLTVAQYQRDRRYKQDQELIRKIRGGDTSAEAGEQQEDEKLTREGITTTSDNNRIIIWEHWVKTAGGWTYHTYSPKYPDEPVKPPMGCPYKFGGKASLPFISLPAELKDKGWYSPRGVAERAAPFETLGCKLMNEFLDNLSFTSKPLLTAEGMVPNQANIKFAPGEILPGNVKRVDLGNPPFELTNVVNMVRSIGEELLQTPDFGISDQEGGQGKPRTATENQRIAQLQDVGGSFNGELLRRRLARLYKHVWGMVLQYKREDLNYLVGDELRQLPPEALHDAYEIQPGGRSDMWNKQQNYQRAVVRLQMLGADPNCNHEELVKDVLAADDPRTVRRVFIPTDIAAANEAEDEAQEITVMEVGFPPQIKPNENHAVRVQVLVQYLEAQQMLGRPVDPLVQQRVQQHLAQHWQYLQKMNPEAARQLAGQIMMMEQQSMAQQAATQQPQPEGAMI